MGQILTKSAVSKDPDIAKDQLARVQSGEITLHPENEKEIMAQIDLSISGDAKKEESSASDFFKDIERFNITPELKKLSVSELELRLKSVLGDFCNKELNVNVRAFHLDSKTKSRGEIDISFSIEVKET